ncbi:unnamed protein product, partial [Ectocarpus sp. 8 AP-2014]
MHTPGLLVPTTFIFSHLTRHTTHANPPLHKIHTQWTDWIGCAHHLPLTYYHHYHTTKNKTRARQARNHLVTDQKKQNHPDRGGFSKASRLLFLIFLEAEEDCGRLLVLLLPAGAEPASSSAAACRAPPLTTGAPARPPSPRRALVLLDERLRFETRFVTTAPSPPSPSNAVFLTPPP